MKTRYLSIFLAMLVVVASIVACSGQTSGSDNSTSAPSSTATVAPTATNNISATDTSSGPTASNFFAATDDKGSNQTNVFTPTDTVYVFFTAAGVVPTTKLAQKWYALDVAGTDPNTPVITATYTVADALGTSNIPTSSALVLNVHLTHPNPLPVGHYMVEVYFDDAKVGEQTFSVASQ